MRTRIDDAARRAGRDPVEHRARRRDEATVPARTSSRPSRAGLTDVGENYVQEARDKYAGLPARKHFIGHIQTNKAKAIVETFDVVQSIDRYDAGPRDRARRTRRQAPAEHARADQRFADANVTASRPPMRRLSPRGCATKKACRSTA